MHQLLPEFADADLPLGFDRGRIAVALDKWRDNYPTAGRFDDSPALERVLSAVFGNSPYLTQNMLRDQGFAARALSTHPDETLRGLFELLETSAPHLASTDELKTSLRIAKARTALITALADIAGIWTLEQVTGALSRFAEIALKMACAHLLRRHAKAGDLDLPAPRGVGKIATEPDEICHGSGFIVLAMGKLGARELNYSSDIDLIALFDPEVARYTGKRDRQDCFNRITRDLVKIIQGRTADGYVFRVDLRLRPDAGATPVSLSTDAAEIYYQSVGLNWERAAMIKARPIAGDIEAGQDFLHRISPFVWRKHLDYAALEDIHAIKKQIHSHHGFSDIGFAGHDIKLGHGGIREIEFFAQTQQLIAGGRNPSLRQATTLGALAALAGSQWVDRETEQMLARSYEYLRRLEHRLQMVNDEQTQKLPTSDSGIAHLAAFMGYDGPAAFERELVGHLTAVHEAYGSLFEDIDAPLPGAQLPFPGGEQRADELAALDRLEFTDSQKVATLVQSWQMGRYRACRTTRARRLLKDITPALLEAISATTDPDSALMRFDDFLKRLPSGIQLFSLFHANPWLLRLTAEIMGSAPSLADALGRNVLLLDAVISPDFFSAMPERDDLAENLSAALAPARDFEDVLEITRRWTNERKFQVGVQVLRNIIDGRIAGRVQTDVAECVIGALLPAVEDEFAKRHGRIAGSGLAIVAMGKMGGRELTPTSDLDLILIYDDGGEDSASDGPKPLAISQYFARLSQRLIAAITALTGEGRLYEVDMRLRPSGQAGPIAVSLRAFADYQAEKAWTWEHMALTRARVIAGPPELVWRVDKAIHVILTRVREPRLLVRDVYKMRQRLLDEYKSDSPWDIKIVRGGLQDLEFIGQYLQLSLAADRPELLTTNTCDLFKRLKVFKALDGTVADDLWRAVDLLQNVQGFLRLCFGDRFDETAAPLGLKQALAKAAKCNNFDELKRRVLETEALVYRQFRKQIEEPAKQQGG